MNDELQHLKNLGKTSAQWLHAVGIHSARPTCVGWERSMPIGRYGLAGSGRRKSCCMQLREH